MFEDYWVIYLDVEEIELVALEFWGDEA